MAEYLQIEYTIDKNGNLVERVLNAKGKSCLDLTEDLESALGVVGKRELLPEYHQTAIYEEEVQRQVDWS